MELREISILSPKSVADYDDKNFPKADGLVNVNVTCTGGGEASSSAWSPCSEGSTCLNGAVGVYCLCYELESALEEVRAPNAERCVSLS